MQSSILYIEQYTKSLQEADKSTYLNWSYNFTLIAVGVGLLEVIISFAFLSVLQSPLTFTLVGISIPAEIFAVWLFVWLKKHMTQQSEDEFVNKITFVISAILIPARLMVFFGIWGHYNWVNDYLDVVGSNASDWEKFFPGKDLNHMKFLSDAGLMLLGGIDIVSAVHYVLASKTVHYYLQDKNQAFRIYSNVLAIFALVMSIVASIFIKNGIKYVQPDSIQFDFPLWNLNILKGGVIIAILIAFSVLVVNNFRWRIYYLGMGSMTCIFVAVFLILTGYAYHYTFVFQNESVSEQGCPRVLEFTHQADLVGYGCQNKYINITAEECPAALRTVIWEKNLTETACLNLNCCQSVSDLFTEIYVSIADDTLTLSLMLGFVGFSLVYLFIFTKEDEHEPDMKTLGWSCALFAVVLLVCTTVQVPMITTRY